MDALFFNLQPEHIVYRVYCMSWLCPQARTEHPVLATESLRVVPPFHSWRGRIHSPKDKSSSPPGTVKTSKNKNRSYKQYVLPPLDDSDVLNIDKYCASLHAAVIIASSQRFAAWHSAIASKLADKCGT